MSYILRALRKSEAERTKGMVPRISTQHEVEAPRRSRVWPAVAALAVVVNGAVLGLVLWQPQVLPWPATASSGQPGEAVAAAPAELQPAPAREPSTAASSGQMPVASLETAAETPIEAGRTLTGQPGVAEPEAAAPDRHAEAEAVDTPVPSLPAADTSRPEPAEVQSARAATPAERPPKAPVAPVLTPPREPAEATLRAAVEETVPMPEAPAILEPAASPEAPPKPKSKPREIVAEKPAPAVDQARQVAALSDSRLAGAEEAAPQVALAVAEPDRATAPRQEPADPYAGVPDLWRMPGSFRSNVPKTTIAVHVYTSEQRGRFIIVDRKKYWEGDLLDSGLLIEAILPEGVVFELGGQRFKLTSG